MGCCSSSKKATPSHEFIPGYQFQGEVVFREFSTKEEYDEHRYQYATTSLSDEVIRPAIIAYAASEEDIKQTIKFAKEKNVAVSIRTGNNYDSFSEVVILHLIQWNSKLEIGGHSYCGSSSTSGPNIQLDVSRAFSSDADFKYFEVENGTPRVRIGISFPLIELNKKLGALGLFVPHGVCENVHVGGHSHTGGYGMMYRSFGLFGDHIRSFEIITADAEKVTVTRESNPELFFAVLGGCPGNFGVLTHIVIEPYRDVDHPNSRGLLGVYLYDKDRLNRLLQFGVDMSYDTSLAKDFDYSVTVMSWSQDFVDIYPNMDNHMRKRHPEVFTPLVEKSVVTPNVIIVAAQWANTGGAAQIYDDSVAAWFAQVRAAADGVNITSVPILHSALSSPYIDSHDFTPLSKLSKSWMFLKIREYEYPYIKSTYSCMEPVAPSAAFSASLTGLIDEVQSNLTGTECKIGMQFQAQGVASQTRENSGNGTAYQWRDVNLTVLPDIWYGPSPGRRPGASRRTGRRGPTRPSSESRVC